MAEDSPKYNPTFEDQAKGFAVGDNNIIYNYFGYREEVVSAASIDAADDNLQCPYRGLYHFSPNDAEYFFGRDVFIETLFEATQTCNFIPVLGASGSGKSSVVLAGLIPKLEQEQKGHWKFTHFRPGSDPFHALALALVPLYTTNLDDTEQIAQTRKLAGYLNNDTVPLSDVFAKIQQNHFNHRILLIADQFEEIYTQCSDHTVRNRFLNCLLASFQSSNSSSSSSTVLVTTMRADFLANALSYRPFVDMLQNADIKLGAMNREELTEVIEKPAKTLGVTFEAGLVERILSDVEDEPGNLPLLEFALTELWKKRTGKQLTHKAYEAIGQVKGALADYADDKYKKLTAEEQAQARRIFIQLVRPGEGTEDTRRRANRLELGAENWNLITRKDGLADSRLVVTSRNDSEQETVEVVHEALIQNWGKLRQWMNTDRRFRAWQERLRVAMRQWKEAQQDEGALLRGLLLVEAEDWQQKRLAELSKDEQDFIKTSLELRDRERRERDRRKKVEKIRIGISITGLISIILGAGYIYLKNQQQLYLYNSLSGVIEPKEAAILPDFFTQANHYKKDAYKYGKQDYLRKAFAYYRTIQSRACSLLLQEANQQKTNQLEGQVDCPPQKIKLEDKKIQQLAKESEKFRVELINKYLIPELKNQLEHKNFGEFQYGKAPHDGEEQYTGARRIVYGILTERLHAGADLNRDGQVNTVEEVRLLPCKTIKELEESWKNRDASKTNCNENLDNLNSCTITGELLLDTNNSPTIFAENRLKQCLFKTYSRNN